MSRKFDQPFVQVSCWVPLPCASVMHWLCQNPAVFVALVKQWAANNPTEGHEYE